MIGEAQLTTHGGQQSRAEFLATALHDALAVTVVEHDVAAFAALHVDADWYASLSPDFHDAVDELPALHLSSIAGSLGHKCPGDTAAKEPVGGHEDSFPACLRHK